MKDYHHTDPEFTRRFEHFAFDEVVNEEGQQLDAITRHMAVTAVLMGCQGIDEFRLEVPRALDDGLAIAMKEANTIVATAKQNADVIISEALLDARELLADITHLAQETQDAKGTMQRQTQRIARLLDEFETVAFPKVELPDKQRR